MMAPGTLRQWRRGMAGLRWLVRCRYRIGWLLVNRQRSHLVMR
jgi:hypothetical protein